MFIAVAKHGVLQLVITLRRKLTTEDNWIVNLSKGRDE